MELSGMASRPENTLFAYATGGGAFFGTGGGNRTVLSAAKAARYDVC